MPDLDSIADPELYRRNAFRLCGLPVDADPRQVRRRTQEVRAAGQLGLPPPGRPALLAPDPAPDSAAVEEALARLRNPARRIVEELFWFWPSPDVALDGSHDPHALRRSWDRLVDTAPAADSRRSIAIHNLAVFAHTMALDRGDRRSEIKRERDWQQVYRYWRMVVADDGCWTWLAGRIRTIDDPRLPAGACQEIRKALPAALLGVHATVTIGLVEAGEHALAGNHRSLMAASGFATATVDKALAAAARIRDRCARTRTVTGDLAALDDASASLLADTGDDLRILRIALGDGHPVTTGLSDEVAERVNICAVRYANLTLDHTRSSRIRHLRRALDHLARARQLAASRHARAPIEENLHHAGHRRHRRVLQPGGRQQREAAGRRHPPVPRSCSPPSRRAAGPAAATAARGGKP